jgi:hypothetical protein
MYYFIFDFFVCINTASGSYDYFIDNNAYILFILIDTTRSLLVQFIFNSIFYT